MEPLRIVQVTPFFGSKSYGGTERYVSHLSKELANRGHYVDVFTTKKSANIPYQSYFSNMTVHRFYSPWNVFDINPACIMLHKLMKIKKIDVFHVHSFIYFTTIQAAIAKMFRKIPMLLHIHGGVGRPPYKTGFFKEFAKIFYDLTLGKFVLSQADIIASVSQFDAELLQKTVPRKKDSITLINNAIFPDAFPEISPKSENGQYIITYVGDLEPWKGISYYSKVVQNVLKKTKNTCFWFIGSGTLYDDLIKQFENNPRVKIYGAVDHSLVPSLLEKTNVLVQPSYWEGSPTTIIEAMAMGIPIIASAIGDIPRLLNNGKSGSMFQAGNIQDLEGTILEVIRNYDNYISIAEKSRKRIRTEFSFHSVVDRIEELYYKLADPHQIYK